MFRQRTDGDDRTTVYVIDQDGVITWVGGHWEDFARLNSPAWDASGVVGRHLDAFIAGDATANLYAELIEKVRTTGRELTFVYRCDGPDMRRTMEMTIVPMEDGRIRFASRIVGEEPRAIPRLLDPQAERSEGFLTICSWCKKAETGRGRWTEIEHALTMLNFEADAPIPRLTHGICPTCLALTMTKLD